MTTLGERFAETTSIERLDATAAVAQILANGVVAVVREHQAGAAVPLIHQVVVAGGVARLPATQIETDREPAQVAAEVDLDREAAARAAKCLILTLPSWPAAQRCARTVVLSIVCSRSASPPLSARVCSSTSQTPERHQWRNCRQTMFQLPSCAGRSRPTARRCARSKECRLKLGDGRSGDARPAPSELYQDWLEHSSFFIRHPATNHYRHPA